MRVGINATCLNQRPSGAKQRFLGVYGALFERLPDTEFVIYEPRDCQVGEWFVGQSNVVAHTTTIPSEGSRVSKLKAGFGYWRQAFSKDTFDLFEALHLPMVRPVIGQSILTIHDVRGLYDQGRFTHRILFASFLRKALRSADHVVTVSETMRKEILAFYPHTPVSVIYNGLDISPFTDVTKADCKLFVAKYGLPADFVLAVGHFEPRKNYSRLIEAMHLLKQRGVDCPLVIIGNDSGEKSNLARQIEALGMKDSIILMSNLSDYEVRCAYKVCSLFVFPSNYEGFGIPILEAMAAQRPMVLSDLPVFREITQGRAAYFSPRDIAEIADAIEIGLTSSQLREDMVEYGTHRLADFSFDRLAESMAEVYRKCS
jgi:glycosyltransferase involved in cell wall biosynthesis